MIEDPTKESQVKRVGGTLSKSRETSLRSR